MKKWYPWGCGALDEDMEFHKKRLLRGKDVVDVRFVKISPTSYELQFAKELTSDEEMEVKTRQTSLLEVIDNITSTVETYK